MAAIASLTLPRLLTMKTLPSLKQAADPNLNAISTLPIGSSQCSIFMSHINPRLGLLLTPASQSSASLQFCLHSRAASTLHHPHLLHPSECWRVRTGSGHDAASARRRWRCVCPAHTGQVSSSATTTSCIVHCKFPF